jgi:hypothetical protein
MVQWVASAHEFNSKETIMTKRTLITSSILSSLALVVVINAFIMPNMIMAAQNAEPLAACGPRSQLPGDVSTNVDLNARCFELRMYTADTERDGVGAFKGGIDDLHQRFREEEVALFEKHGAEIIGVWQDLEKPNTLVWMLAYRDLAHRAQVWEGFGADPAWEALRLKYNVPLQRPQVFMMSATDYSNLK